MSNVLQALTDAITDLAPVTRQDAADIALRVTVRCDLASVIDLAYTKGERHWCRSIGCQHWHTYDYYPEEADGTAYWLSHWKGRHL